MKTIATALTRPRAVMMPMTWRIRIVRLWAGVRFLARARAPGGFFSTGPQWGLAIDVLDRLLASGRLALHPVTKKVGQNHVVPAARQAHFHNNGLELTELMRHVLELGSLLDPTGVLA